MNIQIIGAFQNNPKAKEHFQFAHDLLFDAFARINIQNINVTNPITFDNTDYLIPIFNLQNKFFGDNGEYNPSQDKDNCALVYSLMSILFQADMICVLPNIAQSLGAGAEIMLARRRKIPPIFILPIEKQHINELIEIYLATKQVVPDIKIIYDAAYDRLMIDKKLPPNCLDITQFINEKTRDEIINQKYIFAYLPLQVSFIFHWETGDLFAKPQTNVNPNT